ncbi:MAG: hypothetical protein HKM07_02000 [Chlamydiae bacterium]|nr:hypothetical protein [Chlamydiota bacterium]
MQRLSPYLPAPQGFIPPKKMSEFVTGIELAFSFPRNYSWYPDGELLFLMPIQQAIQFLPPAALPPQQEMASAAQALIENTPLENRVSLNDLNNPTNVTQLLDGVFKRLLGVPHSLQDLLYLRSAAKAYDLMLTFRDNYGIDFATSKGKYLTSLLEQIDAEIQKKQGKEPHPVEVNLPKVLQRIQSLPPKEQWKEYQHLLSLLSYQHEVCGLLEAYTRVFFLVHILKQDESFILSADQSYRASQAIFSNDKTDEQHFTEFFEELTEFDPGLALIFCSTFTESTKEKLQFDEPTINSKDFFADVDHIGTPRLLEIIALLRQNLDSETTPKKLKHLFEIFLKTIEGKLVERERKKIDKGMIPIFKQFFSLSFRYQINAPDFYQLLPLRAIIDSYSIAIRKTQHILQTTGSVSAHDLNMMNFLEYYRYREEYEFTKDAYVKAYKVGYAILFAPSPQKAPREDKIELFSRRISTIDEKNVADPDQLFGKSVQESRVAQIEEAASSSKKAVSKKEEHQAPKVQPVPKKKKDLSLDALTLTPTPVAPQQTEASSSSAAQRKMSPQVFAMPYSDYVESWFTDPAKALEDPRFRDLPKAVQDKMVAFHAFSKEIDKHVLAEGLTDKIRQDKAKKGETHYFLPGRMTVGEITYMGVYGYAFDRSGTCYHRCFTETNAHALVKGYLTRGFHDIEFPSLAVGVQPGKKKALYTEDPSETVKKVNSYTMEIANHGKQTKATVYLIKHLTQDVN